MQISNVPVACHNCQGTSYGRENTYKQYNKMIVECVWVCSNCGQVTKRHSEEIPLNNNEETK